MHSSDTFKAADNQSLPEETRIYNSKTRPISLAIMLLIWYSLKICLLFFYRACSCIYQVFFVWFSRALIK